MKISTTDPEAALSSKRGASEFADYDNYLIDNRSCIIAGVMATPARLSQEIMAARQMLDRAKERFGLQPVSVSADKSYGTGEFLSWLSNRQMTPYIPVLDRKQQTKGFYTQHEFTHVRDENAYRCPGGELLHYIGMSRGTQGFVFATRPSQCRDCAHKPACAPSTRRTLKINWYEDCASTFDSSAKHRNLRLLAGLETRSRHYSPNYAIKSGFASYDCAA